MNYSQDILDKKQEITSKTHPSFYTLIIVFFFWGFIAASTGVFIPFCKEYFKLEQWQSQVIDFSIYIAYFLGAFGLIAFNKITGKDIINLIGFKKGIIYGLLTSAIGSVLMIASFNMGSYGMILFSYFIIGLGFSLQQTCAQPFAVSLGHPSTGGQRLSLAGGINSLGTTIGPIILGVILSYKEGMNLSTLPVEEVKHMFNSMNLLYIVVTLMFLAVAVLFWFSKMPEPINNAEDANIDGSESALKFPQVILGMIAIFTYVGVEVSVQSNLGELMKEGTLGHYNGVTIATFISLYWGSLMVGRWTSGASVFKKNKGYTLNIIASIVAYSVVVLANYLILNITGKWHELDYMMFVYYAPAVLVFMLLYVLGKDRPATTLLYLGVFGIISILVGLFSTGKLAVYSFVASGLACSIMWPFIFTLSISGLGKYTGQGSSYLIMMIIGGGTIPVLQGFLGDEFLKFGYTMQPSYFIAALCFAYLTFFAIKVRSVLKAQGIDADSLESEGGH